MSLKDSGVSRISFRGVGVQTIFCKSGGICMARGEATRLLGGLGACSPEKILIMVQFGAFWRIFNKKTCKNIYFYIKNNR